ncbi:MAG: glycosyltransferase family 9 protein, partial [Kiritimatiellia bacterium]
QKLKAFCAYPALLLHLRRQKYEAVFHLEPGQKTRFRHWRDKLFFRLAGIKVQYSSTPFRKPRPTDRPLPRVESEADFYLRVLREYGRGSRAALPELLRLETGEKEEGEWAEWLNRNPLPPDRIPVGVGIGSKMPAKQWPLDRFQPVLSNLLRENQVFPVFFGGSEDKEAARALVSTLGNGASACGELSLKGSIRGMRDMNYYLGNDTGTMHMAVAAGLRCVAVFSARDVPGKWEPSGEGHIVHRSSVECEGCMLTVCTENKNKCLTGISAREVLASCRALLQPKP